MKKIFLYSLFIIAIGSSCQKDLDMFVPDPIAGPDSTWFNTLSNSMPVASLKADLLLPSFKDSIVLGNAPVSLNAGSGLLCGFPGNSILTATNQTVTGKVELETYLLQKKGDMIRMGTPTTSNGRVLVSGGELFIRLTKDGNDLQLAQGSSVSIRYADSQPSPLMSLFFGSESNPAVFDWLPNMDTINRVYALSQTYEILSNRLRWINCDMFYDTTGIPQTIVSAGLPSNYTNANTVAFTVFDDMRSVIGMYGNAVTRKFSTGKLPVNKPITVIIISKQGNDYYLGHEQVTTAGNSGTTGAQTVAVTPVLTSLVNIKAYLDNL